MIEIYNYLLENIYQFLGVFFSIVYVIFSIRQNILCWPALIIAALFNIYAYHLINLSLQVLMQFFFIGTAIYGWFNWKRKRSNKTLKISQWHNKKHFLVISIGLLLTVMMTIILNTITPQSIFYSNYPFLDSLMFMFNIIPMYMTGKKIIESWLYFIAIDILSGFFYAVNGEYFFSFLFFCYIGFALSGYITWKKEIK